MSSRRRAFFESLRRRAIGRGEHSHVDLEVAGAADAIQALGLQHTQQAGLQVERHLGDFIEQQRSAAGALENTLARAHGASETAALVAKEFRFDERGRNRRAVDRDEGFVGPRTHRVHRLGHQLLAAATLAADEHGRIRRRDAPDEVAHLLHGGGIADQPECGSHRGGWAPRVNAALAGPAFLRRAQRRSQPRKIHPRDVSLANLSPCGLGIGRLSLETMISTRRFNWRLPASALLATGNPSP